MTEEQKRRHGHRPQKQRKKQELPEIFFCGDPHGEFSQILSAARDYKPAAMVILGDLQPSKPLEEVLAEAMAFTEIWWIPGNHDTDSDAIYDNLWKSPSTALAGAAPLVRASYRASGLPGSGACSGGRSGCRTESRTMPRLELFCIGLGKTTRGEVDCRGVIAPLFSLPSMKTCPVSMRISL